MTMSGAPARRGDMRSLLVAPVVLLTMGGPAMAEQASFDGRPHSKGRTGPSRHGPSSYGLNM
jgi:hypothetical protein